jgi:prepilin-type N-terminal cleavage/methylation domain-containing protein
LRKGEKGFTLIELLVVTAILVIITSLVLVNSNRFGGTVLLQNLAYDVALSVREAQVYGISVRSFSGEFDFGYGMHFDAGSQTYVLFADALALNGLYDCPNPELEGSCERVESTEIQRNFRVVKLCAPAGITTDECMSNSSLWASKLDILFKRPEPDACISADDSIKIDSDGGCTLNPEESARVVLESPRGDRRGFIVEATGQISVE